MINYIVPEYRNMDNLMRDDSIEKFFEELLKKHIFNTDKFEVGEVFYDIEANCLVCDFIIEKEVVDEETEESHIVDVHYEVEFYSDTVLSHDFDEDLFITKIGSFYYKQFVVGQGYSILWKDNPFVYEFKSFDYDKH